MLVNFVCTCIVNIIKVTIIFASINFPTLTRIKSTILHVQWNLQWNLRITDKLHDAQEIKFYPLYIFGDYTIIIVAPNVFIIIMIINIIIYRISSNLSDSKKWKLSGYRFL